MLQGPTPATVAQPTCKTMPPQMPQTPRARHPPCKGARMSGSRIVWGRSSYLRFRVVVFVVAALPPTLIVAGWAA